VAAEGGRVGDRFVQSHIDCFQDSDKIAINVAIPKSKDPKAGLFEVFVAPSVASSACVQIMLPAVDLDDKTMFQTNKIYDVALSWRLATEMKSTLSP